MVLLQLVPASAACHTLAGLACELLRRAAVVRPQVLPEKEARAITSQIFAGLAYLNEPGRRFIHYDLK